MSTSPKPAADRIAPEETVCILGASDFTVADILCLLAQRLRSAAFGWLRMGPHRLTRDAAKSL